MNPDLIIHHLTTYPINIANAAIDIIYQLEKNDFALSKANRLFHTHTCAEILSCYTGSYKVAVGMQTITLNSGDFIIIPNTCSHLKDYTPDIPWTSLFISCKKSENSSDFNLYDKLKPFFCEGNVWLIKSSPRLCETLLSMTCFDKKSMNTDDFFKAVSFFSDILTAPKELVKKYPIQKPASLKDILLVERLNHFILSGKMKNMSLADAAKELFISERQLNRYSKHYFGKSFSKMKTDAALETAAYYLVHSDKSIEEISDMLNMGTTFSRQFRKHYLSTPSAYRKKHKS